MKRLLGALVVAVVVSAPAQAQPPRREGYRPPVVSGGMAFPVARSRWYSVINFRNDWHEPRMRFIDGRWKQVGVHEGSDIMAEPGTPVLTVLAGRVERIGWTFYSGWRVGIRGSDRRYWFYAHLKDFAPGLTVGTPVAAGDVLGTLGNTGYGVEPGHADEFMYHLHIGIQEPDGGWVNPYPLLRKLYKVAVVGRPGT